MIQRQEMSRGCLLVGKGFDTFSPLGPCIATGLDPTRLELRTRVNGEEKQHTNTADMIFSVAQLISYTSAAITLLPGDVIMTGTPSGVGSIVPGDVVEVEIEGVGMMSDEEVDQLGESVAAHGLEIFLLAAASPFKHIHLTELELDALDEHEGFRADFEAIKRSMQVAKRLNVRGINAHAFAANTMGEAKPPGRCAG